VFERLLVFPRIRGGTRVEWLMDRDFTDPLPYTFQLQVGTAGDHDISDWTPVGSTVVNGWYLLDDQERVFGLQQWTHYRVQLVTSKGTYYSDPAPCLGLWDFRQWRRACGVLRNEMLNFRAGEAPEGYLLKRRVQGEPCSCLDPLTQECRNPDCLICYGTSWVGGYFQPLGCVYAALSEQATHSHIEAEGPRGAGGDIIVKARMLALPQLQEKDVWINKTTDHRYIVHTIQSACEIKGVPLVYDPVELRLAPFTNIIYDIPIPDLVPQE
jgi:hypothetical protein